MSRHTCGAPVSDEDLVAYWADDLAPEEAERVEGATFACAACAEASQRVERIAGAFRGWIPAVLSAAQLEALREGGLVIEEGRFAPGARREAVFRHGVDLMIHRLGGLDLAGAARVEVTISSESSGETLFFEPFAPFDPVGGEVLIACQRHFAALPADVAFDVRALAEGDAELTRARYLVPHVFAER